MYSLQKGVVSHSRWRVKRTPAEKSKRQQSIMASEVKTQEVNLKRKAECLEPVSSDSSAHSHSATEDRNKIDHKARQYLRALVDKPRVVHPLPEKRRMKKMKINVGGIEKQIKTSLMEMEEELKASDIGRLLLRGGLLVVPVVDYIKDKYKLMSVETTERLERELKRKHQELISMGFSEDEIIHSLTGEKKPSKKQKDSPVDPKDAAKDAFKEKYRRYRDFQNEYAEIKVKEALETGESGHHWLDHQVS